MSSGFKSTNRVKSSIVPWVLPREDIPINIELPKDMDFDTIQVKIPTDFKFVDFFNVGHVDYVDNVAVINGINRTKIPNTPLYFGFIVSSNEIPTKLKTSKRIIVEIHSNNKVIEKINLNARIFRPMLEITEIVEKIELNDDKKVYKVPMNLKYIGFGDIKLKREAEIEGRIVSQGQSLIDELLRRIYVDVQENATNETCENRNHLQLEEGAINRITSEIEKRIMEGNLEDVIDDIDPDFFEQYFTSTETKNEFLKIVYTRLDDILINFLTDIVDKYPTDNVRLQEPHTNIYTKIDSRIDKITIRVLYKDKLDNIYPPVEIQIKIIDQRIKNTEASINMPMVIKKWEEDPFLNVAEMEVKEDN
ncbi:MAG: hypothetical protein HVN34_03910 [Methanobacteriaceae archaeon]|nr:hypothetical protein [Methanobacteriaceae archaeon]